MCCKLAPRVAWSSSGYAGALSGNNSGQVANTHVSLSVTKQYNLVPAKGWWCSAAGKVTLEVWHRTDHASQTLVVYPLTGPLNGHGKGDEHLTYAPYWGMVHFTFLPCKSETLCCRSNSTML